MTLNLTQNHFDLFGLPTAYAIDLALLDQTYRKLQAEVHPDRFAAAAPAEKLRSIQAATHVNEAYRTLKSPIARARYLLHLRGVDVQEETNTAMPATFLMQQMEWRESLEEATKVRDVEALEQLLRELRQAHSALEQVLNEALGHSHDYPLAAESVRKLRFFDKVREEIERALEALEDQ